MKKEIIKYTVVFLTLIVIVFTYSVLVVLLPDRNIKKNITKSVHAMMEEGDYAYGIIHKRQFFLDNFTDAIFLSQNYSFDRTHPVNAVMLVKSAGFANLGPLDAVKRQVDLEDVYIDGYPRYWHGNSFLLRPFLLVADYSFIRWLLYAVSSILLLILGIKLFQTLGMLKTIAFATGLLCVNIFVTQFSIQFCTVVILAVITSILMCKHFRNRKKILLISFIIGCLTAYFDLLTAPLLTCGLPLIVYLSAKNEDTFKKKLQSLFLFAILWGVGYALTWASKWALATMLTDINVFKNAFETILYRTGSEDFSRFEAITDNFKYLPVVFMNLIFTFLLLLSIVFFNKKAIKTNLLLLIVATFPYLWYLVLAQHSWCHPWFTYRIQAISIIAILFILINFISWDKVRKITFPKKKTDVSAIN